MCMQPRERDSLRHAQDLPWGRALERVSERESFIRTDVHNATGSQQVYGEVYVAGGIASLRGQFIAHTVAREGFTASHTGFTMAPRASAPWTHVTL